MQPRKISVLSSNTAVVWLQAPEKVLDAPDLTDDYYLNLLDWSSQNVVRFKTPFAS
jgi:hypothetical protein